MPRSADVCLEIADENTADYTRAKNPQGDYIDYWYQFTGGDDAKGNVEAKKKDDEVSVLISLKGASNGKYDLKSADYKPGSGQYGDFHFEPVTNNKITIKDDAKTDNVHIDYNVIATPKNASQPEIVCDPRITNKW